MVYRGTSSLAPLLPAGALCYLLTYAFHSRKQNTYAHEVYTLFEVKVVGPTIQRNVFLGHYILILINNYLKSFNLGLLLVKFFTRKTLPTANNEITS